MSSPYFKCGPSHSLTCKTLDKIFLCVNIAAFIVPEVPPVYCKKATSSNSLDAFLISYLSFFSIIFENV